MDVIVNGDRLEIKNQQLSQVLESLGFECKRIVVALNETFVPRKDWETVTLTNNDRLDVLSRIEGG